MLQIPSQNKIHASSSTLRRGSSFFVSHTGFSCSLAILNLANFDVKSAVTTHLKSENGKIQRRRLESSLARY
jgi:hypothetical protein